MKANKDLIGKKILFTGATSGLGKIAAMQLAAQGAHVIAGYRNEGKKDLLLHQFESKYPNASGRISFEHCDLNDLESVEQCCLRLKKEIVELDMMLMNAGLMNSTFKLSKNNIEQTLQVNLLAPMLITHLMIDKLARSKRPKLIYTSSALHQGKISFEDMEFRSKYSNFKSYRQSKLGLILLTRYMADYFEGSNLGFYTYHPGVVRTDLSRDASLVSKVIFKSMGKAPERGAEGLIHLASQHQDQLKNGAYYAKKRIAKTSGASRDMQMAERLMNKVKEYLFDYLNHSSILFKY